MSSREFTTQPARLSPPIDEYGIEDPYHAVEVPSLGDPVAPGSADVRDDLRHRAARNDALGSTPDGAVASSPNGLTTASSLTAISCTQDGVRDGPTGDVFGVIMLHGGQRSRELRESIPFSAPRKTEQVFVSGKHAPHNIPAFNTLNFPHRVCPPDYVQTDPEVGGWAKMLHPDGSLYFLKPWQGKCGSFTIVTEAYLYGEDVLHEIMTFAQYMWRHMVLVPEKLADKDFELVINVKIEVDTDKIIWSYYFIDHIRRMPFWMRDYNPSVHMRTTERLGASSPDHLRYLLKAMYWEHCALYPCSSGGARALPEDIHQKLVTDLAWCAAESIITPIRYTAPYTAEEAVRLRKELDCLRKNSEGNSESYIEIAGRTMSTIERWRYDCLHGTQVIRRFRGQTVLPLRRTSVLYRALTPLLFYAPLAHLYDCRSMYLDGVVANEVEWTMYVKRLLSEWQEFVLYAVVLLNANVAFLAVPNTIRASTNDGANPAVSANQPVSPAAVLSFSSMLACFGSIIMGLLLIRQHRGEEIIDNPRANKAVFIEKRRSAHFGFELLSICYSLPSVLLMWSVILFLCAFVVFAQLSSSWLERAPSLAGLVIIIVSSFWCIRVGWDSSLGRDFFRYREHSTAPRRGEVASAVTKILWRLVASIARLGAPNIFRAKGERGRTKKEEETV